MRVHSAFCPIISAIEMMHQQRGKWEWFERRNTAEILNSSCSSVSGCKPKVLMRSNKLSITPEKNRMSCFITTNSGPTASIVWLPLLLGHGRLCKEPTVLEFLRLFRSMGVQCSCSTLMHLHYKQCRKSENSCLGLSFREGMNLYSGARFIFWRSAQNIQYPYLTNMRNSPSRALSPASSTDLPMTGESGDTCRPTTKSFLVPEYYETWLYSSAYKSWCTYHSFKVSLKDILVFTVEHLSAHLKWCIVIKFLRHKKIVASFSLITPTRVFTFKWSLDNTSW